MLTPEENQTLTTTGPDTPMGQVLRKFWIPALLSSEIEERNSDPKALRLLGEKLVAFRDENGTVAVIDEACPHRGVSLTLARAEGDGLRCLYHGWKIGCSGRVLDTPNEPDGSWLKDKVKVRSYPVQERGGMVWVFMGPAEEAPELPDFEWLGIDPELVLINKVFVEANWVQALEGVLDSSHVSFLHTDALLSASAPQASADSGDNRYDERALALVRIAASDDKHPKIEVEDTAYGFRYAAIREPIVEPERYKHVRITHFVAPMFVTLPTTEGFGTMQIFVPVDDHNVAWYAIRYSREKAFDKELHAKAMGLVEGVDIDSNYQKMRNRDNRWMQDRSRMRNGTSFSGIEGVNNEDFAIQESMGFVVDRTKEHLGLADRAVIRGRRILLRMAKQAVAGEELLGGGLADVPYGDIKGTQGVIEISAPWQSLEAPPVGV